MRIDFLKNRYKLRKKGFNHFSPCTATVAVDIWEYKNRVEDQATTATIVHPQTKVTDLSFVASNDINFL